MSQTSSPRPVEKVKGASDVEWGTVTLARVACLRKPPVGRTEKTAKRELELRKA